MLRIYGDILRILRVLRPVIEAIGQHDIDLARQVRRASTSVPLNVAEGAYSRGRNRAARYHTAAGSMNEVLAAIEVAVAVGYITPCDEAVMRDMRIVIGTLMKNARG
jgi:four helix bundle protein